MKSLSVLHRPWIIHLSYLVLALIFLSASLGKILDIPAFTKALAAYQLLPDFLLNPLGHFLPWLEFMIGLSLLVRRWPAGATLLATLMMLLFIVIISITMLRGLTIDCGCFTLITEDSLGQTLIRDIVFLVPCLILLSWQLRPVTGKGVTP